MNHCLTPFDSILVANRGEIAWRIMRTARQQGLQTVAVYTEADASAPHVAFADRAVCIGVGPVGDSYLRIDKLIDAARSSGAQAIHPGYGFLSENAGFARACRAVGLVFIGPGADAIDLMGNKALAKTTMIGAGVPCVPGYCGADQSVATLRAQAHAIGYPVMIKAAAGGGGRGMRLVAQAAAFENALSLAQSEARNAFGSDQMILEKALLRPRHVEVQVFADRHGTVLHLGERDCSVQRRHQKVVEEAPCPVMTPELRERMGATAVEATRAIGYEGAGTVEFLLDDAGDFYFLEMNTRLQVEHPVTEMVTGLDLVALQLRVARGEPIGLAQQDVRLHGHAIEVRLYAEDPAHDFMPSCGDVLHWSPGQGDGVRVDAGIVQGQTIAPHYDPMLAKLIAHGATREQARRRLVGALRDTILFGPATNRDFLLAVLDKPAFRDGQATTAFIAEQFPAGFGATSGLAFADIALAAAVLHQELQDRAHRGSVAVAAELLGWGSQGVLTSRIKLGEAGQSHALVLHQQRDGRIEVGQAQNRVSITRTAGVYRIDGVRVDLRAVHYDGLQIYLTTGSRLVALRHETAAALSDTAGGSGNIAAPMHGNLLEVCVRAGDRVAPGQRLAVLEAMKMQHELCAEVSGVVTAVLAEAASQVRAGDRLIEIAVDGSEAVAGNQGSST